VILYIAAEPREFSGFLKFWNSVQELAWPVHWARSGNWNGRAVVAIANGAGGHRAIQAIEAARQFITPQSIWSIGFCGALDDGLNIGNIFVATTVRRNGSAFTAQSPRTLHHHASGVLASINHVAASAAEKSELRAAGAAAVEMEAAGIAAIAEQIGIPFYCVRSVSDLAHETFACDFNASLREDGKFDVLRLVGSAMLAPRTRIPELVRLQRRCAIASENLGEFLASCEL
jgi:nucleoside phosphorylase